MNKDVTVMKNCKWCGRIVYVKAKTKICPECHRPINKKNPKDWYPKWS